MSKGGLLRLPIVRVALSSVAAAAISYVEGADDETWRDLLKAVEMLKASGWRWK